MVFKPFLILKLVAGNILDKFIMLTEPYITLNALNIQEIFGDQYNNLWVPNITIKLETQCLLCNSVEVSPTA